MLNKKDFLKYASKLAFPIMIQNLIGTLVNMEKYAGLSLCAFCFMKLYLQNFGKDKAYISNMQEMLVPSF